VHKIKPSDKLSPRPSIPSLLAGGLHILKLSTRALVSLLALLLISCTPTPLPKPSQQPITSSQLIGRWRYLGDYQQTTIEIEFLASGTFRQIVTLRNGAIKRQQGTWQLQGANLSLENLLINDSSKSTPSLITWKPNNSRWWFTEQGGQLALIGGEGDDPNRFVELNRQN
jgi:hypothetical protein